MNPTHSRRTGVVLMAMLGVLAMLALPSLASAHHRSHHRASGHHGKRHHHRRHHHRRRHRDLSGTGGPAGTIASFDSDTGKLVIDLGNGDTVSGLVTDRTRIRCGGGCDKGSNDQSGDQGASASASVDFDGPRQADNSAKCTTADLVVGATVQRAELVIVGGKAYFTLVAVGQASGSS
jgi:hypothetical protein